VRVGFVGAGRMGAPMIARLVGAGHEVQALGRTDGKRAAVAELGATPVAELRSVADTDVVIVCVFTDDQVRQLCLEGELVASMRADSALVLHTTGSPHTAQAIATRHPQVYVVDAPVSGGPHDIAAGRVTVFVGGSDAAVAQVRPALTAYADPILRTGTTGSGQLVKLVNNALFAAQIGLVTEGTRLGSALGIEESALLAALTHGSSQSRVLGMMASAGSSAAFLAAVEEFLGKDVAVVRATIAEMGGDLGLLEPLVAGVAPP
jgi:3-hydroxyisobutyrate dehydrogenase-like beta-hydroxyacid dehydrogenase